MNNKVFLIILISLICFNNAFISYAEKNQIYRLENNSSISLSEIISFQDDIIIEYNKNFNRYPPENKQLYDLFFLNSSHNSTILLSYDGSIGFFFEDNKISNTYIGYLNDSQTVSFFGFPFGGYINFNNVNIYGSNYYVHITNVYNLNHNLSKKIATDYYLLNYAHYLKENARMKQIEDEKLQKINKSAEEL